MCEDVLLTPQALFGCCGSGCSLHIHPQMMGLMMSLLWQFVPGVRGSTLKLGKVEGQWNRGVISELPEGYIWREKSIKNTEGTSAGSWDNGREIYPEMPEETFRERLILTHERYSGGNKRLTLQVCIWQMLLKILLWKKLGKNPGFIVLKSQWQRRTLTKKKSYNHLSYYLGYLKVLACNCFPQLFWNFRNIWVLMVKRWWNIK